MGRSFPSEPLAGSALAKFLDTVRNDKRFGPEVAEYRYLAPVAPRYGAL
ncbi:MAG: hypothetical protein HY695_00535 [Deltaproteobacteria bacterium]|nr:hypothetical protein [Deltaproteobacteria bacterium]